MKKFLSWCLKACISGILALVLLTGFSMVYYNVPVDAEADSGATDYTWQANKVYSRGTEGFATGKTNNEGYLNTFDYAPDMEIHVLVMGSSHMEAYQVAMDESTAAVMGQLIPDKTVYNIGVSSHSFMVCADNLEAAVKKYAPTEYVVIETSSLWFTNEQLRQGIDGEVPDFTSHGDGIIGAFKKNPFIRLAYTQLQNFMGTASNENENAPASQPQVRGDDALYDELLANLQAVVSTSGAHLIILYHPSIYLNEDGSLFVDGDEALAAFFGSVCENNGITFLDMTERFLRGYEENLVLPHGFSNTSVGSGHLNRHGHAMIAESLYDLMKEGE